MPWRARDLPPALRQSGLGHRTKRGVQIPPTTEPRPPQSRRPRRLGPRPLPPLLASQATTLLTSQLVLPLWRSGCIAWKPHLAQAAEEIRRLLETVDAHAFQQALTVESYRRIDGFVTGIEAYRRHPYCRTLPEPSMIWQDGTTRLLDYGEPGAAGLPVLVIPSLINRAYILDLTAKRSFMRYLAAKGFHPYLVDWGAPGPQEAMFGLDDYVVGRLGRILDALLARGPRPVIVGYCMGGLLALALGTLRQDDVRGLGLLATPWDFHAPSPAQAQLVDKMRQPLEDAIALFGELPTDLLQLLFSAIGSGNVAGKFIAFGHLKARSVKARDFVALEDWLNDGVPLVNSVARECLFDWYVGNRPGLGLWRVSGQLIVPKAFIKPCLAVIPAHDRIVPPESALALAASMPNGRHRLVPMGHIGMMTGARSKTNVYAYITKWLNLFG